MTRTDQILTLCSTAKYGVREAIAATTICLRCEQYIPTAYAPYPPCQGKHHHGFNHGCTCQACKQLVLAYKQGQLTLDDATITEFERLMRRE